MIGHGDNNSSCLLKNNNNLFIPTLVFVPWKEKKWNESLSNVLVSECLQRSLEPSSILFCRGQQVWGITGTKWKWKHQEACCLSQVSLNLFEQPWAVNYGSMELTYSLFLVTVSYYVKSKTIQKSL